MPELNRTLITMLGLVAACGPSAPQTTSDEPSTGGAGTGTGTGPTSEPTSSPTEATSTDPPECVVSDDCAQTYCGYCDAGMCREGGGCCGAAEPARPDLQLWRCGVPWDCYGDEDCGEGDLCADGQCIPSEALQLPACPEPGLILRQWQLGVTPGAFLLADLDGDGDLDLAAAQPSVAQIQIALNDGDGNFTLAGAFGVGAPAEALDLVAGDLDGDQDIDLAVLRRDPAGGLLLLFGQDAVFTPQPLPTEAGATALFLDRSGGAPSLLVAHPGGVSTHLGDGQGDFGAPLLALAEPLDRPSLVEVHKDGRLDLVGMMPGTSTVGVWPGDSDSHTFGAPRLLDTGFAHTATLAGVLNPPDDLPALVLTRVDGDAGAIEVRAGIDHPDSFAPPFHYRTTTPLVSAAMVHFDDPPGPDLIAATGLPSVTIVLGSAKGGFACERVIRIDAPTTQALLAVGDLNGDQRPDLVVGDPNSPQITVLLAK